MRPPGRPIKPGPGFARNVRLHLSKIINISYKLLIMYVYLYFINYLNKYLNESCKFHRIQDPVKELS